MYQLCSIPFNVITSLQLCRLLIHKTGLENPTLSIMFPKFPYPCIPNNGNYELIKTVFNVTLRVFGYHQSSRSTNIISNIVFPFDHAMIVRLNGSIYKTTNTHAHTHTQGTHSRANERNWWGNKARQTQTLPIIFRFASFGCACVCVEWDSIQRKKHHLMSTVRWKWFVYSTVKFVCAFL